MWSLKVAASNTLTIIPQILHLKSQILFYSLERFPKSHL